jgi:hypothetical protein
MIDIDRERIRLLEDRLYKVEQKVGLAYVPITDLSEPEVDEECECGHVMSAHSGGMALLHHDQFMIKDFFFAFCDDMRDELDNADGMEINSEAYIKTDDVMDIIKRVGGYE